MSWNAFKIIGFDPPSDLTISIISKSMKVFEKDYKVNVICHSHPDMLTWRLELEEKVRRVTTRSTDVDRNVPDVPPPIHTYMFGLSVKEKLLFIQKRLSKKMQVLMAKALNCTGFELLDMECSNPADLRSLYTQSSVVNPGEMEFQYQRRNFIILDQLKRGFPISNFVDVGPDKAKKARLTLGAVRDKIPRISNVKVSVENAPVKTENPKLQGFRFSHIDMEVSAPSVFHLYLDLVEQGIISDLPPWIQKMRSRGSTRVNTVYK